MKILEILPVGGLGNRLLSLASCRLLARLQQWRLCMLWTPAEYCPCVLEDLWAPGSGPMEIETLEAYPPGSVCMLPFLYSQSLPLLLELMEKHPLVSVRGQQLFHPAPGSSLSFREDFKQEFLSWVVSPYLASQIPSLPAHTVGIHIRRQDHIRSIQYSPLILFLRVMKKELAHNPDTYFFISTDDPTIWPLLTRHIPEQRLLRHPKGWLGRDSLAGMQAGFLDLITLSRCCRIYGAKYSSFCKFAAQYGDKPLHRIHSTRDPGCWHKASSLIDPWISWSATRGWRPARNETAIRRFKSFLALLYTRYLLSPTYQLGFWHRAAPINPTS
ncbi:MAG: hypothetical protein HC904_16975 [Blastochloris sp.]|nr:hypothetical protein [Blastochloris sp.]